MTLLHRRHSKALDLGMNWQSEPGQQLRQKESLDTRTCRRTQTWPPGPEKHTPEQRQTPTFPRWCTEQWRSDDLNPQRTTDGAQTDSKHLERKNGREEGREQAERHCVRVGWTGLKVEQRFGVGLRGFGWDSVWKTFESWEAWRVSVNVRAGLDV